MSPVPVPDPDSEGFWSAHSRGQLAIARCQNCRRWQHPPTEVCRICGGTMTFEPVSGRGTVFSFIVVRQATVPGHVPPYVVALVTLDEAENVRISGLVRADSAAVRIGSSVEVVTTPATGASLAAPEFLLTGA
jgi:uncharacterized OB-fold protein